MTQRNTNIHPAPQTAGSHTDKLLATGVLEGDALKDFTIRLHEFLDFYQLFDTFITQLRKTVPCDSIEFHNEDTDTTLMNGYAGENYCEYTIRYDTAVLGNIRVTRDSAFSESEMNLIEVMLAGLTLPLRNALRYQQAIRLAQRDELTGLRNGSYYHDIVALEIERSNRYETPFSLLMLDLDDFEEINQRYGRGAGDAILHEVAQRLRQKARGSDVIYRNGGDEFLAFLPNTERQDAVIVAERIRQCVSQDTYRYKNEDIRFTVSVGVVTVTQGDTADRLIDRADRAIFHAKILGKDRIFVESANDYIQRGS